MQWQKTSKCNNVACLLWKDVIGELFLITVTGSNYILWNIEPLFKFQSYFDEMWGQKLHKCNDIYLLLYCDNDTRIAFVAEILTLVILCVDMTWYPDMRKVIRKCKFTSGIRSALYICCSYTRYTNCRLILLSVASQPERSYFCADTYTLVRVLLTLCDCVQDVVCNTSQLSYITLAWFHQTTPMYNCLSNGIR